MIQFRTIRVDGVPAVEMLDSAGRRVGIIYVEDDGESVSVMSDRFDGGFTECVEFKHAQMASGMRVPPVVRMTFRVADGNGVAVDGGKGFGPAAVSNTDKEVR